LDDVRSISARPYLVAEVLPEDVAEVAPAQVHVNGLLAVALDLQPPQLL
jgi:hypothetical protein